jgi:acyl-CoA synthetase (AMP-forming)/AMP-acid ligase II
VRVLAIRSTRDMWETSLPRFPRKPAVIDGDTTLTFAQADERIERLRAALAGRLAVRQHENVALLLPNSLEYFLLYWALVKLGAVVVPVNTRLAAAETRHILDSTDARVLVVAQSFWRVAREALAGCPGVQFVVPVGFAPTDAPAGPQVVPYGDLAAAEPQPYDPPAIAPDDLAILMHTSGTTGLPKGAVMRHADLLFNVRNAILAQSWRHEDVHLLVLPMFHATALYSMLPSSA